MQFCEFFKNQFTALRCVKYHLDYYLLILFTVIDFQPFTVSIHISGRWKGSLFLSLRAQLTDNLINQYSIGICTL